MLARINPFSGCLEIAHSNIQDYASLPIANAIDGASAPDALEVISDTNKIQVRQFQGDTGDQDVFFSWPVPSDLLPGETTIQFRVVFLITNATAPAGEGVVFGLKGGSLADGDALSKALGTAVVVASGDMKDVDDAWQAETAFAENAYVIPSTPNGYYYKATAVAGTGTSGVEEPTWPTTIGETVIDNEGENQITWTCMGLDVDQYDRVATPWSAAVTIAGLAAGETALLNLYRDQDHASDTYAQKVGVAFVEIKVKRAIL